MKIGKVAFNGSILVGRKIMETAVQVELETCDQVVRREEPER